MSSQALSVPVSSSVNLHTILHTPTKPSAHPTLLLLHFWGGSNQTFSPLISFLENTHTVIAPSLRGWGQSSKPGDPHAYGIIDYAADIVALLQHIKSTQPDLVTNGIVLVGHSMGGKLAQVLLTYAEVAASVKGVVLIAPAPSGSFSLPGEMREQQIHAYDAVESAAFVVENVLLGRPENVSVTVRTEVAEGTVAGSPGARASWPEYGMGEDHETAVMEAVKGFGGLKILVVVGEFDRVESPENVERRVTAVLRNADAEVRTERLEMVGHLIPLEATEQLSDLVKTFVGAL